MISGDYVKKWTRTLDTHYEVCLPVPQHCTVRPEYWLAVGVLLAKTRLERNIKGKKHQERSEIPLFRQSTYLQYENEQCVCRAVYVIKRHAFRDSLLPRCILISFNIYLTFVRTCCNYVCVFPRNLWIKLKLKCLIKQHAVKVQGVSGVSVWEGWSKFMGWIE
jgi:hypothetical protein